MVQYCAKYDMKCEPQSQPLKEVYSSIAHTLRDDNKSLKAVQKPLINTVGEHDYSAQETCHPLLQLPMYNAFEILLCLALMVHAHVIEDHLQRDQPATAPSTLDHYI